MKRVRKLGAVTFNLNAAYVQQDYSPNTFISNIVKSAADTDIIYYAVDNNPEIVLESQGYALVDQSSMEEIINMYNQAETEYQIEYVDGTTQNVIFKLDSPPEFKEYGTNSCLYTFEITLTKI